MRENEELSSTPTLPSSTHQAHSKGLHALKQAHSGPQVFQTSEKVACSSSHRDMAVCVPIPATKPTSCHTKTHQEPILAESLEFLGISHVSCGSMFVTSQVYPPLIFHMILIAFSIRVHILLRCDLSSQTTHVNDYLLVHPVSGHSGQQVACEQLPRFMQSVVTQTWMNIK